MNKFYLSNADRKIGGVCAGVAEFLGIDVTIVRIIWLIAVLCFGTGILIYLIIWAVAPRNPNPYK